VKNPYEGKIVASQINEVIFDDADVKKEKTEIVIINQADSIAG